MKLPVSGKAMTWTSIRKNILLAMTLCEAQSHRTVKNIILAMNLTAFLLLVTALHVSANTFSQKISIKGENLSLPSIFKSIRKQTGYQFVYTSGVMEKSKPVTVNLDNVELTDALNFCLKDQQLVFEIKNNIIVINTGANIGVGSLLNNHRISVPAPPVTGIIHSAAGQPVAGANIIVKGTKRGTTTNADGSFSIEANNGEMLIISSIGFAEKQVIVANNTIGIISLAVSESKLDEIQVIAYGTTTKRLNTGNVSTVKAADIEKSPVSNPLLALSGRVPGVFINQNSGIPGGGIEINVQGLNSISHGNHPFYVIDGVPYTSQLLATLQGVLGESGTGSALGNDQPGSGNPLSYINPNNIESIEILKDADATAIYGSRAANGAVLITTKKGKSGKTGFDIMAQSGTGQVGRKIKFLNTQQYLQMRKEAYINENQPIPTSTDPYTAPDLNIFDQNRYTDWQKELIGGTARYTDIQASVLGGSNLTTFRLNGTYHKETTVFPGDFNDVKGSVSVNINHSSSNNKFKLQFITNLLNDNNELPPVDVTRGITSAPNAPALYTSDGKINWNPVLFGTDSAATWTNPIANFANTYNVKSTNLISSANLSYAIFKGLVLKTNLGYTNIDTRELYTNSIRSGRLEYQKYAQNLARYSNGQIRSWIIEPQLSYNFDLAKGHADFLLGSSFQQTDKNLMIVEGNGFVTEESMKDYSSATTLTSIPSIISRYRYNALFGRLNYNWTNKYVINFTIRRDGSSRFGTANRFNNFGAVGAGWIFTNEKFISEKLSGISFGKLRVSYGTTGNDQIGDYGYLNQYTPIYGYLTPNPYQGITGAEPARLPNPYLQWELTKKMQIGLDLGFFKDRLLLNLNYYDNRSSNQLLDYNLSSQAGFTEVTRNFPATVQNKGLEVAVTSTNIKTREFIWSSNFNLTVAKNKLLSFPNLAQSTYANSLVIGQPTNILRLFNFAGVNPQTGLSEFYTADGKITTSPDNIVDKTVFFSSTPTFYGGIQNTFSYKGFDIDFLFQFAKQRRQNYKLGSTFSLGGFVWNEPVGVLKRWQKPGDITDIQKSSISQYLFTVGSSNLLYSDASYARLKNMSVSWNVPAKWIQSAKMERCRLFAQGQNLFTITNYAGLDPENATFLNLPPLRTITFGLQVTF
jgi:TonB-dependent starch-binding outer membrane protein SusC